MWTALAQTYKELQQWNHAAKCYERNIALNPVDVKALHFLGFIYIDNLDPADHDKAAFYFRKAIDVAGEDAEENESTLRTYGARFQTEFHTRGCHWIPRMFT
jgi:tetratricopeptide (TPR) repeat protein